MNPTKSQKIIIVLSVIWVIISLLTAGSLAGNNYGKRFEAITFLWICFCVAAPVWLYWAGVWIWGDGYIFTAVKRFGRLFSCLRAKFFESKISAAVIAAILVIPVSYVFWPSSNEQQTTVNPVDQFDTSTLQAVQQQPSFAPRIIANDIWVEVDAQTANPPSSSNNAPHGALVKPQASKPIAQLKACLKIVEARRPYSTLSPEIQALTISNSCKISISTIVVGWLNNADQNCPTDPKDYAGLKRFTKRIAPLDSVVMEETFSTSAKHFCLLDAH